MAETAGRAVAKLKKGDTDAYVQLKDKGLELTFQDEWYLTQAENLDIGEGKLLLTSVEFISANPDYTDYAGKLPHGFKFGQQLGEVQKALGKPSGPTPTWATTAGRRIRCGPSGTSTTTASWRASACCGRRSSSGRRGEGAVTAKTGDQLLPLLGRPADDPEVEQTLQDFAIQWPPELDEPSGEPTESDWYAWRPSRKLGFELGFLDQAYLEALDPSLRGKFLRKGGGAGQSRDHDQHAP